jgi:hypothetical protein
VVFAPINVGAASQASAVKDVRGLNRIYLCSDLLDIFQPSFCYKNLLALIAKKDDHLLANPSSLSSKY